MCCKLFFRKMESVQSLRILSQIFSPAMFEKIVREQNSLFFYQKVNKYFHSQKIISTNLDVIKSIYRLLQQEYRCEYIYKNNLLLNIIKKYRLQDTLAVNEFKIGTSKADLVLLNGSARVYEIKTEFDDFGKLSKQITDYEKFADTIHIVTNDKYAQKLKSEYGHSNVGIIVLNKNNQLIEEKEAQNNYDKFDFDTLFKILRKQEYLDLIKEEFGFIPDVPNTKIFKTCYGMLQSRLSVRQFQQKILLKLKERKLHSPSLLISKKTPKELKYICNSLNLKDNEYQYLFEFLAKKH